MNAIALWEEYSTELADSESVAELNATDAERQYDTLCFEAMTAAEYGLTVAELRYERSFGSPNLGAP